MKRISILILSVFCSSFIYSQDTIDGFFGIKIGMSEEDLVKLVGTSHIKDYDSYIFQERFNTTDVKRLAVYNYLPEG